MCHKSPFPVAPGGEDGRMRSHDQQGVQRSWSVSEGSKSQTSGVCRVMCVGVKLSGWSRFKHFFFFPNNILLQKFSGRWLGGERILNLAGKRERENSLLLWPYYLSNAQGKFLKSDDGWRENGERERETERQRDVDSVQGSVRGMQIREAYTAVKYSCAGSHSALNWCIISGTHSFSCQWAHWVRNQWRHLFQTMTNLTKRSDITCRTGA